MLRAIVIFAIIALVKGQLDSCDFTNINTPVNLTRLDGLWYELSRIPNNLESGNCSTVTFSEAAGTLVIREVVSGEENFINGTYSNTNVTNDARFVLTINGTSLDMTVLATNYDGYALIVNCVTSDNTTQVLGWTLSRNSSLSAEHAAAISDITALIPGLNNLLVLSDHSEDACKVNASTSLRVSVALLALVLGAFKLF